MNTSNSGIPQTPSRRISLDHINGKMQSMLPLWRQVIFVDWNGVLNDEPFWSSIFRNPKHPLKGQIQDAAENLFAHNKDTVRAWMTGSATSEQIVRKLDIHLDRRYKEDYVLRRLYEDCRQMQCDPRLASALRAVRTDNFVVLATDNMDCFWRAIVSIRHLTTVVDAVLCSSELGMLKNDSVHRFFGPWLERHQLQFTDALLLDDSRKTCEAFRSAGGTAVEVGSAEDAIIAVQSWQRTRTSPC